MLLRNHINRQPVDPLSKSPTTGLTIQRVYSRHSCRMDILLKTETNVQRTEEAANPQTTIFMRFEQEQKKLAQSTQTMSVTLILPAV